MMRDLAIVLGVVMLLAGGAMFWLLSKTAQTSDDIRAIETNPMLVEEQRLQSQLDAAGIDRDTYNRMAQSVQEAQR
jgi:CHASE3 domain sensor protein